MNLNLSKTVNLLWNRG